MSNKKYLHLIGYASGLAGAEMGCGDGPLWMQRSPYLKDLIKQGFSLDWEKSFYPEKTNNQSPYELLHLLCGDLAKLTQELTSQHQFFCVIGGDHTSAIGTWSGVYDACHQQGDIGLIWIDAHMDSHTPKTTESGNIHGMPLAALLGYGDPLLTDLISPGAKLKPEHVCLIGVRSFEKGEADLLKRLNVKIYFMEEVKQRGLVPILKEARDQIGKQCMGYGISLDLDSIDPPEAPAVDVPAPDGLPANDLLHGLSLIATDPKLLGMEIVEFDPHHDIDQRTEKLIAAFLAAVMRAKGLIK